MTANKTAPTDASVDDFLRCVEHAGRRDDSFALLDLLKRITGAEPVMWGPSIVGFGFYHYKYDSGREGDWFLTGFSPRKASMTVYVMPGFKRYGEQLARLGKHRHSVSCLYLGRLSGIALDVLETIIADSVNRMREIYPDSRL